MSSRRPFLLWLWLAAFGWVKDAEDAGYWRLPSSVDVSGHGQTILDAFLKDPLNVPDTRDRASEEKERTKNDTADELDETLAAGFQALLSEDEKEPQTEMEQHMAALSLEEEKEIELYNGLEWPGVFCEACSSSPADCSRPVVRDWNDWTISEEFRTALYIPDWLTETEAKILQNFILAAPKSKWVQLSRRGQIQEIRCWTSSLLFVPNSVLFLHLLVLMSNPCWGFHSWAERNDPSPALQVWGGQVKTADNPVSELEPLPKWLQPITRLLSSDSLRGGHSKPACSRASAIFPSSTPPNHVLVNQYQAGEGIMAHQDGPAYAPLVVILSLGSSCVLNFFHSQEHAAGFHRSRQPPPSAEKGSDDAQESSDIGKNVKPLLSVFLEPRSLFLFAEDLFTKYYHAIEEVNRHPSLKLVHPFPLSRVNVDGFFFSSSSFLPQTTQDTILSETKGSGAEQRRLQEEIIVRRSTRYSLTIRHAF